MPPSFPIAEILADRRCSVRFDGVDRRQGDRRLLDRRGLADRRPPELTPEAAQDGHAAQLRALEQHVHQLQLALHQLRDRNHEAGLLLGEARGVLNRSVEAKHPVLSRIGAWLAD